MLALYPRKNIINVVRWREKEKEIIPRTMTMDKDEATPLSYYSRATPIFFPMPSRMGWPQIFNLHFSSAYRSLSLCFLPPSLDSDQIQRTGDTENNDACRIDRKGKRK